MISFRNLTHDVICNNYGIPNYFWPKNVYSNILKGHSWMITMSFAKSMKLRLIFGDSKQAQLQQT
jgi:hypothetical protein